MFLDDFMNEAFYNFNWESEEIEVKKENSKEVELLAKKIAKEIQEKMENNFDAKHEEKDVIFTLRIKMLDKNIAESTVKFRTEYYPDYIDHESVIKLEMELDQITAGLFAVDGVKMDELSKQALIGLSKNNNIRLELKKDTINLRGKLYVKIAMITIPAVALSALVAYGIGKSSGLKETTEQLKHKISNATLKDIDKAKNIINNLVKEIHEKILSISSNEIIAAITIGIVATIGAVIYITRLKKTKKEQYELAMILEHYEGYKIVNDILKEDTNYGGLIIPGSNMDKYNYKNSQLIIPEPKMDKVPSQLEYHNLSLFDKFKEILHSIIHYLSKIKTDITHLQIEQIATSILGLFLIGLMIIPLAAMTFKNYTISTKNVLYYIIGNLIWIFIIQYLYYSLENGKLVSLSTFMHSYMHESVLSLFGLVVSSAFLFAVLDKVLADMKNPKDPKSIKLSIDTANKDYMKLLS